MSQRPTTVSPSTSYVNGSAGSASVGTAASRSGSGVVTTGKVPRSSLDRDRLGEIPRLVDVVTQGQRGVVGEQLQRNDHQDRVELALVAGYVDPPALDVAEVDTGV